MRRSFFCLRFFGLAFFLALCSGSLISTASAGSAAPESIPADSSASQIAACAEARAAYNLATYPNYSVKIVSTRQGINSDGKLAEDYKVIKTVKISGSEREERFIRGERNGEEADVDDFWLEKYGMSKRYNAEAMNMFSAANRGRYDYRKKGTEELDGHSFWKLEFSVKEKGGKEMQTGTVWVDQKTCGVGKAEGSFPDIWVTEGVTAKLSLLEVKPGFWVPLKQRVDMNVSIPFLKRHGIMIDDFSEYKVVETK